MLRKIKLILLLLIPINFVMAQPGGGPGGGGDPGHGKPVPLTGIEILIGAGILIGSKRLLTLRQKKNNLHE